MAPSPSSKPGRSFAVPAQALLLMLLVAAAFAPAVGNQFLNWDDQKTISGNPDFNPPTVSSIARSWKRPQLGLYIPMTYTVWGAIAAVAYTPTDTGTALDPVYFHLANLIGHLVAALLVWLILRRLTGQDWPAWLGAALFAVHPVQVESVAWTSGTKDVLCGLLSLGALWFYLGYAQRPAGSRGAIWMFAGATLAVVLAMLAKPAAIAVPLLALVVDRWLLHRSWRAMWPLAIWMVLLLPLALFARLVQPSTHGDVLNLWQRPFVAADALAFYLFKIAWPRWLGPDYGRSPDWLFSHGPAYITWIVPALLVLAALTLRRKAPWVAVSLGLFATALLPMLGLASFDFQYYSTVSDHYLYLAMLGPAVCLAFLLCRAPAGWRAPAVGWIALLAVLSFRQTQTWHDNERFFRHALAVNPTSVAAHSDLGFLYSAAHQPDLAIEQWNAALQTRPDDPWANYNLANVLAFQAQRPQEAVGHYLAAIQKQPDDDYRYYSNLGIVLARLGRLDEAEHFFRQAVQRFGDVPDVHLNDATLLTAMGRYDDAIVEYQAALRLSPDLQTARLGLERAERMARATTTRPASAN